MARAFLVDKKYNIKYTLFKCLQIEAMHTIIITEIRQQSNLRAHKLRVQSNYPTKYSTQAKILSTSNYQHTTNKRCPSKCSYHTEEDPVLDT